MGVQGSKETADMVVLTISGMTCGGCATVTGTAPAMDLIRAVEAAGFAGSLP